MGKKRKVKVKMATMFQVQGPFEITVNVYRGGKIIPRNKDLADFWEEVGEISEERGCYVFGIRAGKGIRPWYVGQTAKSFKDECFTGANRSKYNEAIARAGKGTPVMFLLVLPKKRGKPGKRYLDALEELLIDVGYSKNPDISNIQKTKRPTWGVKGVLRGGKGKPKKAESYFRKMMGV
jgi:hypothetical protein